MPSMIYLVTGECLIAENDLPLSGDSYTLQRPHKVEQSWLLEPPGARTQGQSLFDLVVVDMVPWRADTVTVLSHQVNSVIMQENVPRRVLKWYEKTLSHPSPF